MTKILVIDDDIAINELIKINLELQGYEVLQAYNGTEGFALVKQEAPALVVLDVMMPEVDGTKAQKEIRKLSEYYEKEAAIIVLTADAVAGMREHFLSEGFDEYLSKPIDIEQLQKILKKYLDK